MPSESQDLTHLRPKIAPERRSCAFADAKTPLWCIFSNQRNVFYDSFRLRDAQNAVLVHFLVSKSRDLTHLLFQNAPKRRSCAFCDARTSFWCILSGNFLFSSSPSALFLVIDGYRSCTRYKTTRAGHEGRATGRTGVGRFCITHTSHPTLILSLGCGVFDD